MNGSLPALARAALFRDVPARYLEQIAVHARPLRFERGAEILCQDDPPSSVCVVESGSVGMLLHAGGLAFPQLVGELGAFESFGEEAVLSGRQRCTYVALDGVVAHAMTAESFGSLLTGVPQVAVNLAAVVGRRLDALATQNVVPWDGLEGRKLDPSVFRWAPEQICRRHRMIPIESSGRSMTVAMVDPTDAVGVEALRRALGGVQIRIVAMRAETWERFVGRTSTPSVPPATGPAAAPATIAFLDDEGARNARASTNPPNGAAVVSLVDDIVGTAIALGASDIHVENDRRGVMVRYRVDGLLRPRKGPPIAGELHRPILSRLKLLAHMDITEVRKPQDGRISVRVDNRIVDLRLSTLPAKFGEKAVMRILDAQDGISDLSSLIVIEKVRQSFTQLVERPQGLVLVSGPTGAGKTTTLYSALAARSRPELNVVTVEDPIEYHLDGVTQVQVQPQHGATFSLLLRSLLRQDPDVIMIGELRDQDTARIATEASMTGHLVLGSIHSNGSIEAALRLADLGVERYAIANGLAGVLHQRLVRRACTACAERAEVPAAILAELVRVGAFRENETPSLKRSRGCAACDGTGFKGRIGLYELLVMSDPVRDAIASSADLPALRAATATAMVGLARYAGVLLASGLTTPGEVLAALQHPAA